MKIYDISQELFTCALFPGDPPPERIELMKIANGEICNLTGFKMCAHNGTHVDAPEGVYMLNAAPINLGGSDGSPCRAVLMSF